MKMIARVIALVVLLCLFSGCGRQSNYDDISSGLEDDAMVSEDEAAEEDMEEDDAEEDVEDDAESPEYAFVSQQKMEGNAVIRPECMLLLKNDGTVVGKGNSEHGELGNGERTGCESWTPVSGLTDVKKIYADEDFGTPGDYGNVMPFCYALTENGDLYRWGCNILEPKCFLRNVENIFRCGNDYSDVFLMEFSDKHKEIMNRSVIFDITKVLGNNELLFANEDFMIIKDIDSSMSFYIKYDLKYFEEGQEVEEIRSYAKCKELSKTKISEDIESVACLDGDSIYVLSKEGAVRHFKWKKHSVIFEDEWGGKGYKYYWIDQGENVFGLLVDDVYTMGENEFGQLGDGTNLDYWETWIKVDEFQCSELFVREDHSWDPYCVALDEDCNIWCWGKGFGSTPQIKVGEMGEEDEDIDMEDY